MRNSLLILLTSTSFIAFLHALAPDHWMPFAAIAKAQRWSKARLLWVTFISGIGHVGISVLFGVVGILLGFNLSKLKSVEGHRGEITLWLLIGFGIAYMLWGIKQARRHNHKGIEQEKIKTAAVWTMFAIFVLGPCETLVPLIFFSYNYGYFGIISVSVVFSIITIVMMISQSLLAFKGIQLIRSDIADRYAHAFAGLVIALTGIFVMVLGI